MSIYYSSDSSHDYSDDYSDNSSCDDSDDSAEALTRHLLTLSLSSLNDVLKNNLSKLPDDYLDDFYGDSSDESSEEISILSALEASFDQFSSMMNLSEGDENQDPSSDRITVLESDPNTLPVLESDPNTFPICLAVPESDLNPPSIK